MSPIKGSLFQSNVLRNVVIFFVINARFSTPLYGLLTNQMIDNMTESHHPSGNPPLTTKKLFLTSTVLAMLISLPAVTITLIMHYVIKTDLLVTLSASLIALFISMGFSIKISKRLSKY